VAPIRLLARSDRGPVVEMMPPAEDGPRTVPPVVPNDSWRVPTRSQWCGWLGRLRRRHHLDVTPDPAIPGRRVCVRCDLATYVIHGRDRG